MSFDEWFADLMSDKNSEIVSNYEPEDFARAGWDAAVQFLKYRECSHAWLGNHTGSKSSWRCAICGEVSDNPFRLVP